MATCNRCGAEGLKWETVPPTRGYQLHEPEGDPHVCKPEDLSRMEAQLKLDQENQSRAVQDYRDKNGYL